MSLKTVLAAAALVPLAVLGALPANAAGGTAGDHARSVARPAVQTVGPSGYVVVRTLHSLPALEQTYGEADCPTGKVTLGGGVYIVSNDVYGGDINSSYPQSFGWAAFVNGGETDTDFYVYAVCAAKPAAYERVEGAAVKVSPNNRSVATSVSCRQGLPLGGGALSSSADFTNYLTNLQPNDTGGVSNVIVQHTTYALSSETFRPWAVCADLNGYQIFHTDFTVAANSQRGATASCPYGVPVGGGGGPKIGTHDDYIAINSTSPVHGGWQTFINNHDDKTVTATTYAVCVD
jgi:hypothetical protein